MQFTNIFFYFFNKKQADSKATRPVRTILHESLVIDICHICGNPEVIELYLLEAQFVHFGSTQYCVMLE